MEVMNCDVDYWTLKDPHLKNNAVDTDPFGSKYFRCDRAFEL